VSALFLKLGEENPAFQGVCEEMTIFTEVMDGKVRMRNDRPFLLISSTSWTKDEDFGILLEALDEYNRAAYDTTNMLPKVFCVITGKGPLKEYYMRIIQSKNFSCVTVCTIWLSAEDYPVLLGKSLLRMFLQSLGHQ
jgi:beta-1,4-mannosyltransferase